MDLRHLRYFTTVAEELHFGRAAEKLGMTQPPLSQAIQKLEEEIGSRLFERTKRTVRLTPVGEQWLHHVRRLLEDAEALPRLARQLARGETGTLNLAFVSTADYSLLPTLISRYQTRFPNVRIALREATSDLQIAALLKDEIDAGLIIPPPDTTLHSSLSYLPLLREPLVLAIPEAWIKSGRIDGTRRSLPLSAVGKEPLILFPRASAPAFHDLITGFYAASGLQPPLGQEAIQMQTIISLVSVGLGIALVPRSLTNLGRVGVRYLPLTGKPPQIETGLVWRRHDPSPTIRRFLETASRLPRDERPTSNPPKQP